MYLMQPPLPVGSKFRRHHRSSSARKNDMGMGGTASATNYNWNYDHHGTYSTKFGTSNHGCRDLCQNYRSDEFSYDRHWPAEVVPSSKRRKTSSLSYESTGVLYQLQDLYQNGLVNHVDMCNPHRYYNANFVGQLACIGSAPAAVVETRFGDASSYALSASKHDWSKDEDDNVVCMSRDEIEKRSPSRKDGIDQLQEAHLRYSYCSFLQNLGIRLDLPQSTIGTAIVLCHRFFICRSHASHDRFLIATAVLFLASKSEETPCALNDVLRVSCEVLQKQDFSLLSYMLPLDWFEQYRERITEAEQLVLTTLNFELNVQHPYESLISTLQKLGFSQSILVDMALNLVSEGLRSSLWLQFKPHQIAAGAAYLAAKFLNMNLASCDNIWCEFHTSPTVLKDIAHQLMELF